MLRYIRNKIRTVLKKYLKSIFAVFADKEQHIAHMFVVINPNFYVDPAMMEERVAQYVKDYKDGKVTLQELAQSGGYDLL